MVDCLLGTLSMTEAMIRRLTLTSGFVTAIVIAALVPILVSYPYTLLALSAYLFLLMICSGICYLRQLRRAAIILLAIASVATTVGVASYTVSGPESSSFKLIAVLLMSAAVLGLTLFGLRRSKA